jgi:hypothetical protein
MIKTGITIILLLVHLLSFTQTKLKEIYVIDSSTKKPIPFVHIITKSDKNCRITNFNGIFYGDSLINTTDSIIISCIGYNQKTIHPRNLYKNNPINLNPKKYKINEVEIKEKKTRYKNKKIGMKKEPGSIFPKSNVNFFCKTGEILAYWVQNNNSYQGYISKVNVYITDKGYPNSFFRLHVYKCSTHDIKPGKELLQQNILAHGNLGNEWVTINISKYNIQIPENGFFIGIEWLPETKDKIYSDTLSVGTKYERVIKGNGIAIGYKHEKYATSKYKVWRLYRNMDTVWRMNSLANEEMFNKDQVTESGFKYIINENNYWTMTPCINAEIRYSKSKDNTNLKDPKKRKLNRIQKTKQDLFKYPQNSIKNLYSSLIKAFENDDIIYVLKYLCVYEDDDFRKIIEIIKDKPINNIIEAHIKERVINEFKYIKDSIVPSNIIKLDNVNYQIKIDNETYNLIHEKGLWKINPRTYEVREMKNS